MGVLFLKLYRDPFFCLLEGGRLFVNGACVIRVNCHIKFAVVAAFSGTVAGATADHTVRDPPCPHTPAS